VLDLDFKSAMSRAGVGSPGAMIVFAPGEGVALSMPQKDLSRVAGAMRSGQRSKTKESVAGNRVDRVASAARNNEERQEDADDVAVHDEDPGFVKIRQSKSIKSVPRVFAEHFSGARFVRADANAFIGLGQMIGREEKQQKAGVLVLKAKTPEQVSRAIDLLAKHAGIEVYAALRDYRNLAKGVIKAVIQERRTQVMEARMRAASNAAALSVERKGENVDSIDHAEQEQFGSGAGQRRVNAQAAGEDAQQESVAQALHGFPLHGDAMDFANRPSAPAHDAALFYLFLKMFAL